MLKCVKNSMMKNFFAAFLIFLGSSVFGAQTSEIIDFLREKYQKVYENFDIKIDDVRLFLHKNSKISDVKITKISADVSQDFAFSGDVILDYDFNGTHFTNAVKYEVSGSMALIVASQNIKQNENFTDKNTQQIRRALNEIRHHPLTKNDLPNLQAKFFITKNTILSENHAEKRILIKKNDSFLARYTDKNLTIEIMLTAEENGVLGAVIRAQNPDTKKILRVKVLSENLGLVL